MKTNRILLLIFITLLTNSIYAQIRIGAGISIGVNIDLPIPGIVVVEGRSIPPRPRPRCRRAVIHTDYDSFGTIQHQNGSLGRNIYEVTRAFLSPVGNGEEQVTYHLDTGDIIEILISTVRPNDYNYHYYDPNCNNCLSNNNTILAASYNGDELPLHSGSLSLQPLGNGQFHSIINLHSIYDGDFNGTVDF